MMMIEILNIKAREARTTRYLALTYVIYAVFGTVFFTVYPCGSLNPDLLPSILDDLIGNFPLLDHISSCPVRRKLSMLYMLLGLYIFSLATVMVYLIDRNYILNYYSREILKRTHGNSVCKRKVRIILLFFAGLFLLFFIPYILFFISPSEVELHSPTISTMRIYADNPGSLLFDFMMVLGAGPLDILLIMLSLDFTFISNHLLKGAENER